VIGQSKEGREEEGIKGRGKQGDSRQQLNDLATTPSSVLVMMPSSLCVIIVNVCVYVRHVNRAYQRRGSRQFYRTTSHTQQQQQPPQTQEKKIMPFNHPTTKAKHLFPLAWNSVKVSFFLLVYGVCVLRVFFSELSVDAELFFLSPYNKVF
jgi:hypothetical protein